MSSGIYKITNECNGKVYIGQSQNIERRWQEHQRMKEKGSAICHAFKKYGIGSFRFEILEECSLEKLKEREIYYIAKYNSFQKGYNKTTGGEGTPNLSIKISNEQIDEIINLLENSELTQNEIAHKFEVGIDTISEINNGKTRIKINLEYPIRNNSSPPSYCSCGKIISKGSTNCLECYHKKSRKVLRPSREILKKEIRSNSFVDLGKKYNVTDNAIKKWCKSYNLPHRKKDIKLLSEEEWLRV